MHNLWDYILLTGIIALICFVTAKAIIGSYFGAKEGFVERMMTKLKGANNGKRP